MRLLIRTTPLCCCVRRNSPYKKIITVMAAIFLSCWLGLLLYQNSTISRLSPVGTNRASLDKNLHTDMSIQNGQDTKRFSDHGQNRTDTIPSSFNPNGKNSPRVLLNANINKKLLTISNHSQSNASKTLPNSQVGRPILEVLPSLNGPDSYQLLRDKLVRLNMKEMIQNADKYPPLADDGFVIIVQVHKRVEYLKQLFISLRAVKNIEKVLLVISHDYYFNEMNQLVATVDFCRVLQIFYPYSLQLFPDIFPGQSKNDCPRDIKKNEALRINCTNALHPDSYGHYREAPVTAIKHHWWWKITRVFDHLQLTKEFNGYVIFLEEDHYVAPDFVDVTRKMIDLRRTSCPDCDFINLGTYRTSNFALTANQAITSFWDAGKHNMGFGMDRITWNMIKSCSEKFCVYDDYNWDWSLHSLSHSCLPKKLKVLISKAPRIMHIGTCGTHHHRKSCNEAEQARTAQRKFDQERNHLFPDSLQLLSEMDQKYSKKLKNYGGWGDSRDHDLCRSFIFK